MKHNLHRGRSHTRCEASGRDTGTQGTWQGRSSRTWGKKIWREIFRREAPAALGRSRRD